MRMVPVPRTRYATCLPRRVERWERLSYRRRMGLRARFRAGAVGAHRLALAFAGVVIVLAAASSNEPDELSRDLDAGAAALLALGLASTWWSRRQPGAVATAVLVVSFVWYGAGYTSGLINVPVLLAFFWLGDSDDQRTKVIVTAASVAAVVVNISLVGDEGWRSAASAAGYVVMAVLFGELVRSRRLVLEQYAERAQRAEQEAERRVAQERLRIARDLHDVLAHSVSAMTVQAGVALDELDRDPGAAREALRSIRGTGRRAMSEVRATVAVLRGDEAGGRRAPAPTLRDLDELVDAAGEHGLGIEVSVAVPSAPLPEVVELTAYRVVQEALTNVVRHADARRAWVDVRDADGALVVEVLDDGQGDGSTRSPGFGLRGMAERVESLGGQVHHGRRADGGWTVRARIPVEGDRW